MSTSMRYRCNCGGKLYVRETRATNDAIWRVRTCRDCGWHFTTKEEAVEGGIPGEAAWGQRSTQSKERS